MSIRNVDFHTLCMNCRTDRRFNLPLNLPTEMYLGINQFKVILAQIPVECFYCGNKGFAGDEKKFELVGTKGLDENLVPTISTHEKRQWFYDLDFSFRQYLKEIFDVNEYENTGYAVDFYECRFILQKKFESSNERTKTGYYMTAAIALFNGKNKTVDGKFSFMHEFPTNEELPEQLIINPKKYSAVEKEVRTKEGNSFFLPLLKLKE